MRRHCQACGAALEERELEGRLRAVCPACGRVAYQNPVPAAAVAVLDGRRVLLGRRAIDPHRGAWGLPAGYQEVDESIETAAVREAREETGLIVQLTGLFDVLTTTDDPRKPSLLVVFTGRAVDGDLEPGSDCAEVAWHDLDHLPDDVGFRNDRRVLERLRTGADKAFS